MLLVSLCLVACSATFETDDALEPPLELPTAPQPPSGGDPDDVGETLRIAISQDPASIDPRFVGDDEGEAIVDALFEPLIRTEYPSRLTPGAAERWTSSDAGATFTFHLRRARFHDGTRVTADDFARTFNRIADGTAEQPSYLDYLLSDVVGIEDSRANGTPLRGIEAIDDRTLRIRLERPQPGFLSTLSDPSLVPTPPQADSDPKAFAQRPIGNGPFAMAGPREPGSFIRLIRSDSYREPASLGEVLFTVYEDDASREAQWADLLAGQLHVAQVPVQRRADAVERFGTSRDGYTGPGLLDGLTSDVYLYGFDTTRPPYDDPRLRRAVSMAIDRQAIAEDVLQGTREAATALVPPSIPGAQPGVCEHCTHDPEAAVALMEEVVADHGADVLDDLTVTHSRGAIHTAIAERIASDLGVVFDVEVDFRALDLERFFAVVGDGQAPLFRMGWNVTTPNAGEYLAPLFHSSRIGAENLTGFDDEDVDQSLMAAKYAAAPQARAALYRSAEREILAAAPVIPLLWYRHEYAIASDVDGLVVSPLGRFSLADVRIDAPNA